MIHLNKLNDRMGERTGRAAAGVGAGDRVRPAKPRPGQPRRRGRAPSHATSSRDPPARRRSISGNPSTWSCSSGGDRIAWSWILGNPGAFASLAVAKWGLMFDSLRLGFTQWNAPAGLTGSRRPIDPLRPDCVPGPLVHRAAPRAGGGAGRRGRRRRPPLAGGGGLVTGCNLVVVALFFGYARFGVMVLPFWYSLIGLAIAGLGSRVLGVSGTGRRYLLV